MSLVEESFVDIFEGYRVNGRYRVEGQLGEGGFAEVYRAYDEQIDREVAVKVMNASSLSSDPKVHEELLERFQREAQLAARVDHPNVANIYDYGVLADKDEPFIVMELLDGLDLEDFLKSHDSMPAGRALALFVPALEALGVAHSHSIVHKDLKPSNLFVKKPDTRFEKLCIFDFGIAHIAGEFRKRLTQQGQLMGTPGYIAPEYATEQIVTPALDVYQMGLILIEMLTGEPVVDHPEPVSAMFQHVNGELEIPLELLESPLGPVIACALHQDHERRFPSAMEFADALSTVDPSSIPDVSNGFEIGSLDDFQPPDAVRAGSEGDAKSSSTLFMYGGAGVDRASTGDTPAPTLSSHVTPNGMDSPTAPRRSNDTDTVEQQVAKEDVVFAPGKSRTWPWLVAGGALLVAGVALVVILTGDNESSEPVAPEAASAAEGPAAESEKDEPAPATATADKPVAKRGVELRSEPANVVIYEGEEALGITPFTVELEGEDDVRRVEARLEGYEPAPFEVTADSPNTHTLVLAKRDTADDPEAPAAPEAAAAEPEADPEPDRESRRATAPEPETQPEPAVEPAKPKAEPSEPPEDDDEREQKAEKEVLLPDF